MLTLFAIPKPFTGLFDLIQRNAIRSWTHLDPGIQIILTGDEPGTAEVARELSLEHVPEVPRSEYGTPLVNGLFAAAEQHARHDVLCYVNSDIILMSDFARAIRRVLSMGKPFFATGRRWTAPVESPLEFSDGWERRLRKHVRHCGKREGAGALDYFIYRKASLGEIPPFAIGRPTYDNWLLYNAIRRGMRLIDITPSIMAVHQRHDYSHDAGGFKNVWEGPEAQRNRELSGGPRYLYNLNHARWLLTPWLLVPAWTYQHLRRRWKSPV